MLHRTLLGRTAVSLFAALLAFVSMARADPAAMSGHVASSTGKPVAGATVSIAYANGRTVKFSDVSTDANGDFQLGDDLLRTSGFAYCVITTPGFAVSGGPLAPGKSNAFTLTPPAQVTGTVTDDKGAAVGGAAVRVAQVRRNDAMQFELMPSVWKNAANDRLKAVTDAAGKFTIDGLEAGTVVDVRLADPRFAADSASAAVPGRLQPLVARPACSISGILKYQDGKPARGWWVQAYVQSRVSAAPPEPVKSGDDGAFVFAGLTAGRYILDVVPIGSDAPDSDGWILATKPTVDLALGRTSPPVTLTLSRGATVNGTVTDAASGAPVANATVILQGGGTSSALTDDKGRYTAHVAAGTCRIIVVSAKGDYSVGWQSDATTNLTVETGKTYEAPPIVLKKPKHRVGNVVDENGKPVAGVEIALAPVQEGRWIGNMKSSADGTIDIIDVTTGKYRLQLPPAFEAVSQDPIAIQADDTTPLTFAVRHRAVVALDGAVTDLSGQPLAGIALQFNVKTPIGKDGQVSWRVQNVVSDDKGQFRLTDIAPDKDTVDVANANLKGYVLKSGGALVKTANGASLAPVVLAPLNASVSGIVLDDDDKAVPGAWVASATSGVPIKSDSAGKFRLTGVAAGDVVVFAARGNAFGSKKAVASAAAGDGVTVHIDAIRPPAPADTDQGVTLLQNLGASPATKVDAWLKRQAITSIAAIDPALALKSLTDAAQPVDDWTRLTMFQARRKFRMDEADIWAFDQIKGMPDGRARTVLAAQVGLDYAPSNPKAAQWLYQIAAAGMPVQKLDKDNLFDQCGVLSLALSLHRPDASMRQKAIRVKIEELAADKPASGQTDWRDSSRRDVFARAVALGDPAQFADIIAYAPAQERMYTARGIVKALYRQNPSAALAAFRAMKQDNGNPGPFEEMFETVLPSLLDDAPAEALSSARGISQNTGLKSAALLAIAEALPIAKALPVYREAFDAVGDYGEIQRLAKVAALAFRRDKPLGTQLFDQAIGRLAADQERNRSQQIQYTNLPEYAYWMAQVDPGYGRVLLETQWVTGSSVWQNDNRNDEWSTSRWCSAEVGAVASLDTDRATDMANAIKNNRARFAASLKVGQYLLASQAARDRTKFDSWVQDGGAAPGEWPD